MIKTLLCATALVAAPMMASALVVEPGDVGSDTKSVSPTGVTSFFFEPTAETTFTFTITANGLVSNLSKLSYGFSPVSGDTTFSQIVPIFAGIGVGVGVLESLTTDLPFYVYFFGNNGTAPSVATVAYSTDEATPAPVPLPAAGGLLALALVGMGGAAAARRRK